LIEFILNNEDIKTNQASGFLVLDFIRYHQNLKGTKIGCREGDCGACTVLIGELQEGNLVYQSVTSCLMPLGNVLGKHVVTIEGINSDSLNLIQENLVNESGTQCGFCTPGFVMSLAGFCVSNELKTFENAIKSINGNICRCTGYKSIERACQKITDTFQSSTNSLDNVIEKKIFPSYFNTIETRLKEINKRKSFPLGNEELNWFIGGGTDLYVQQHDTMVEKELTFLSFQTELRKIIIENNECIIGAACTVSDLWNHKGLLEIFPNLHSHLKLVSSTPIRNMATVGGNLVNASPIGDLTIFFLALNSKINLQDKTSIRTIALQSFYKGYKQLDKKKEEFIHSIQFKIPNSYSYFNFEKVSKRTHLDIASVNSALLIEYNHNKIQNIFLSAGGVGPTPKLLENASKNIINKEITEDLIFEICANIQNEISPISDARGSKEYKRLLLNQLIKAHFLKLFPHLNALKLLSY
jgi:xanthine dehydrogenase small subunit